MGLLDSLFSSSGGLLDLLKQNARDQQFPGGLPSDTAQYGPMPTYAPQQASYAPPVPQNPPPVIQAQPGGPISPQQAIARGFDPTGARLAGQPPAPAPQVAPQAAPQMPNPFAQPARSDFARGAMLNSENGPIAMLLGGIAGSAGMLGPDPQQQQAQQRNITFQALTAKGVSPNIAMAATLDPTNFKEVYNSAFGKNAPTVLGNGYIWQNGKVSRAYTPDDKLPPGYAFNDEDAGLKGGIHYLPNGPADPAQLAQIEAAKKKAQLEAEAVASQDPNKKIAVGRGGVLGHYEGGKFVEDYRNQEEGAELSDDTAKFMAQQYITDGNAKIFANLGRGAQGAKNVIKVREAIKSEADKMGLDGSALSQRAIDYEADKSAARTLGTQEGKMTAGGIEAMGAIKNAREASAKVPRGNFVPLNQVIQAYDRKTGDPNIRDFGAALNTVINTYAKAINPTGVMTVDATSHARHAIMEADSMPAFEAVMARLEKEIEMAHNSPAQARALFAEERRQRLQGGPDAKPGTINLKDALSGNSPATANSGTVNGVPWMVVK